MSARPGMLVVCVMAVAGATACRPPGPPQPQPEPPGPICTREARLCPDGSAVGRTGADCSFAPCPSDAGAIPGPDSEVGPDPAPPTGPDPDPEPVPMQ